MALERAKLKVMIETVAIDDEGRLVTCHEREARISDWELPCSSKNEDLTVAPIHGKKSAA
jgi:hypothetical protein